MYVSAIRHIQMKWRVETDWGEITAILGSSLVVSSVFVWIIIINNIHIIWYYVHNINTAENDYTKRYMIN